MYIIIKETDILCLFLKNNFFFVSEIVLLIKILLMMFAMFLFI